MKAVLTTLGLTCILSSQAFAASCLYINSYHIGYEWSDRLQTAFHEEMKHKCSISYLYLNAKRVPDPERLKSKGLEIANLIPLSQPDIVIATDDAASKYVVQPFLRNGRIPVIFAGINWDPSIYGYPMDNATGMTEIWPMQSVIETLKEILEPVKYVVMISSENTIEHRDASFIGRALEKNNIKFDARFVNNFTQWKEAVLQAQTADAIRLGTYQGIEGWDQAQAIDWLKQHNQKFTFASQDFMLPYVMFSLSKSPEEFGHWIAAAAESILTGTQPWQLPIVPNREMNLGYNPFMLKDSHYKLPDRIQRIANTYQENTQK